MLARVFSRSPSSKMQLATSYLDWLSPLLEGDHLLIDSFHKQPTSYGMRSKPGLGGILLPTGAVKTSC